MRKDWTEAFSVRRLEHWLRIVFISEYSMSLLEEYTSR